MGLPSRDTGPLVSVTFPNRNTIDGEKVAQWARGRKNACVRSTNGLLTPRASLPPVRRLPQTRLTALMRFNHHEVTRNLSLSLPGVICVPLCSGETIKVAKLMMSIKHECSPE